MKPRAHLDFETASPADLTKTGVYRYAEDAQTRAWLFRYRIGDGPRKGWRPGQPDPVDLLQHVAEGGTVVAHNAAFERVIWNWWLRARLPHWPVLQIEQMDCTMARAMAMDLPGSLELLGTVCNFTAKKDMEGAALMKRMMRPRKVDEYGRVVQWWDAPENIDRLEQYCDADVGAEEEADFMLPPLSANEKTIWNFDQLINERGIQVDVSLLHAAEKLIEKAKQHADARMAVLTMGAVKKCSESGKLLKWIQARGVLADSMAKHETDDILSVAGLLGDVLVAEAVKLRASAGKASVSKIRAMLDTVCRDGRIRGLLQYYGAGTGRWAGRLVQPQNLPRLDWGEDGQRILLLLALLRDTGHDAELAHATCSMLLGPPLEWLSKALRSFIIAAPGRKLVGGDFSNIEGRVNAWLAGEQWKVDAFAAYDAGTGHDLYKLAYGKSFGVEDIDSITKPQRQLGKVQELALGYQGSVGAFLKFTVTYNMKLEPIVKAVREATPPDVWDAQAAKYAGERNKYNLPLEYWTAIKIIVVAWRKAHPRIVQSWWNLQDAVIAAVDTPGEIIAVENYPISFVCSPSRDFLYCILPNGRLLAYPEPQIVEAREDQIVYADGAVRNTDDYTPDELEMIRLYGIDKDAMFCTYKEGNRHRKVTCAAMEKGNWWRYALYGGLICENIVQAVSRDILVEAMFRVEAAGYPVVLTVHDEILTEPPVGFGSEHEFVKIMSVKSEWYKTLPLSAAAWEDQRYVK